MSWDQKSDTKLRYQHICEPVGSEARSDDLLQDVIGAEARDAGASTPQSRVACRVSPVARYLLPRLKFMTSFLRLLDGLDHNLHRFI